MNVLLLGLALSITAPASKDAAKKDTQSIVGEWVPTEAIRGGKPDMPPPGTSITFTEDGKLILKEGNKAGRSEEGTYKADAKKNPAEVDLLPPKGEERAMLGIYKFEKDKLILCLARGGDRPKKFESPEGTEVMLITLERAKKE
jgi:uncharacterized protein (TIGR03067 family)